MKKICKEVYLVTGARDTEHGTANQPGREGKGREGKGRERKGRERTRARES